MTALEIAIEGLSREKEVAIQLVATARDSNIRMSLTSRLREIDREIRTLLAKDVISGEVRIKPLTEEISTHENN